MQVVIVENDWLVRAKTFSIEMNNANAQSKRNFASEYERTEKKRILDAFEGKVAEIAFFLFSEEFCKIRVMPDFSIYPNILWTDYGQDCQDVEYDSSEWSCRSRIDVKATRPYSKWLLVESHKFLADAYVLILVNLPENIDTFLFAGEAVPPISCTISGFAYYSDLISPEENRPWFEFSSGKSLFVPPNKKPLVKNKIELGQWYKAEKAKGGVRKMNVTLQAQRSYGMPRAWLRNSQQDWESFFSWMIGSLLPINDKILGL